MDLCREAEECLVFQKTHSWISSKAITEMVATDLLCGECIKWSRLHIAAPNFFKAFDKDQT